ncbi:MAG: GspH/FimT family pseudopilin [bacterium]|nr:GspH/FimT family pseudopilin [bacterium]
MIKKEKYNAFTMTELLVVMSIMVVIMAMIVPFVKTFGTGQELKKSAVNVASMLRLARQMAITMNATYRVDVNLAQDAIYISDLTGSRYEKAYVPPPSVDITAATPAYGAGGRISFNSRGTCQAGTVRVTSRRKNNAGGYDFYEITTSGSAGRVRIKGLNET